MKCSMSKILCLFDHTHWVKSDHRQKGMTKFPCIYADKITYPTYLNSNLTILVLFGRGSVKKIYHHTYNTTHMQVIMCFISRHTLMSRMVVCSFVFCEICVPFRHQVPNRRECSLGHTNIVPA